MATHHFADVAQQRQVFAHGGSFVNCRAYLPHESASLSVGPILREERQIEELWRGLLGIIAWRDLCLLRPSFRLFAPVAQLPERDASNVGDVGESPSGSAN